MVDFRVSRSIKSSTRTDREKLDLPLSKIGIPVRIVNALNGEGVEIVEDLLYRTKEELLEIENFGEKSLAVVLRAIRNLNLEE
jgi:DNA-directed RNA polymerase alpha subunit